MYSLIFFGFVFILTHEHVKCDKIAWYFILIVSLLSFSSHPGLVVHLVKNIRGNLFIVGQYSHILFVVIGKMHFLLVSEKEFFMK